VYPRTPWSPKRRRSTKTVDGLGAGFATFSAARRDTRRLPYRPRVAVDSRRAIAPPLA
jgi:hypothetical protein